MIQTRSRKVKTSETYPNSTPDKALNLVLLHPQDWMPLFNSFQAFRLMK